MAQLGRVLKFDEARGYGFIAPDNGGSDVFVHANDFEDDESRFTAGTRVQFEVMDGDRGKKAYAVRVAEETSAPVAARSGYDPESDDETLCDVLTAEELRTDLTEMLLNNSPELTAAQIVRLRTDFLTFARKHGWVDG